MSESQVVQSFRDWTLAWQRREFELAARAAASGNPPVADHFDATATIVDFWHRHAGLP